MADAPDSKSVPTELVFYDRYPDQAAGAAHSLRAVHRAERSLVLRYATGEAKHAGKRRPAGYYFKTERTGSSPLSLFGDENFEDLPLVNRIREDVRRWREAGYPGASEVTKQLLRHWNNPDRHRRFFFCQLEAVETVIYLSELRISKRSGRTGFRKSELTDEDIDLLLHGKKPGFDLSNPNVFPTLVDLPGDPSVLPLRRLGCKMATGSGKTVVMAMLIAWGFCNRGRNPASHEYPNGVLVCCPNLTVKERLQVLRPEREDNYCAAFDIMPSQLRPLLPFGKVLISNWHAFAEQSPHVDNGKSYVVVNKGPETPETFARRVLGELADRRPIMVFNDEGHHCWRPKPGEVIDDEGADEQEIEEATIWVGGLDKINNSGNVGRIGNPSENAGRIGNPSYGISMCIDLSATPFYIQGSGHPEGSPFPWLVSDFGLMDAIESGIVKIPRLPVSDSTGRPEAKYFRLWQQINEEIPASRRLPGKAKKPKPDAVYEKAQPALQQLAGQWKERFEYFENAGDGQQRVPPVMIIVCDNTDIAEIFFQKISGEHEEEIVAPSAIEDEDDETPRAKGRKAGPKKRTIYGPGDVYSDLLANQEGEPKRTIRIDSKLLAEAESDDPHKRRSDAAEELRQIVATVGKIGQPGEHVRCVVSVSMLTEGWDANNVTHILGIRAFGSQLLCKQVVGRGLRRVNYTPDKVTSMLPEEYVDVYGIPFSVIPFRGRPVKQAEPDDRPLNHVRALPERKQYTIRFPVVEGYAFALRRNLIRCEVAKVEKLGLEPHREPTATFLRAPFYAEGPTTEHMAPFDFFEQDRAEYYSSSHIETIKFQIAQRIVGQLISGQGGGNQRRKAAFKLQSRTQLFPQVFRIVDEYVRTRVDFRSQHPCELGLEKYMRRVVERLRDAIEPDADQGEPPLLPIINSHKPIGTSAEVDFVAKRACRATKKSHINQVVLDTQTWEASAAFWLESCPLVYCYARNDQLGLVIPYEYDRVDHNYTPDYLVRFQSKSSWWEEAKQFTALLEIKGYESEQDRAKHSAARRWASAVSNWGELGRWEFVLCSDPQTVPEQLQNHCASNRVEFASAIR